MSLTLIIPVFFVFVLLISQFGGKITARSASVWWLVFGLVLFCTIFPSLLEPITSFFGIQLVSNFVLGSLILFLFFHGIQESSMLTQLYRKQRDLNSSLAAAEFMKSIHPNGNKTALIFFPCFNEESYLPKLLNRIRDLQSSYPDQFDFCIINDGSTDQTASILKRTAEGLFIHHPINMGVSGVLSTAFRIASLFNYAYVIQVDADGQHPIEHIPELLTEAQKLNADLLIGSRFLHGRRREQMQSTTRLRSFGSLLISYSLKMFSWNNRISDPTSGFRVYSSDARKILIKNLPDEYPEPESIALLISAGLNVVEVPVRMSPRTSGQSSLNGLRGAWFVMKVSSALIGLRLRTLFRL